MENNQSNKIKEVYSTTHSDERTNDRLHTAEKAVGESLVNTIRTKLDLLKSLDFKKINPGFANKSFAVFLGNLIIYNWKSPVVAINRDGKRTIRFIEPDGKQGDGNQLWAIVRNNTLTTVMPKVDVNPSDQNAKRIMNVDYIIKDIQAWAKQVGSLN